MIKIILWDFDGVILNSMKIKGDAFLKLFEKYDSSDLKKLENYHYLNGGISRFDKIEYFFKKVLKKNILESEIIELANRFGKIVINKLDDKNNLIEETLEFIKNNYTKYVFHIVSGAEHHELNSICTNLDLTKYFESIQGSPTHKDILVKNLLKKYKYNKKEVLLIGDSMSDYNAARSNSIKFYGFNNINLKKINNIEYINCFNDINFME